MFTLFHPNHAGRRHRIALILTAALSLVIFVFALIPLPAPPPVPGTDKDHHLIAFAAFTLPCAALAPRSLLWVLPAIIAQAGLIEIIQPFVNRLGEWADFTADLKGVGLGLVIGLALHWALVARRVA